ncbi:DMT family transporter, partial [Zhenpiania hominis]|uniref:DMT family transporter n=1 Tax=Zhenpiania hominis TaxID=2763644 RepID=UPI0039F5F4F6
SSFLVLIKAMESLPSATVYAVFTGIGTAGTNVVDTLVFGESFSFLKVFFIALLLAGVIGLKLVTHRPTAETANLPEAEGVS